MQKLNCIICDNCRVVLQFNFCSALQEFETIGNKHFCKKCQKGVHAKSTISLRNALKESNYNGIEAAKLLGITKQAVYKRCKKLGILTIRKRDKNESKNNTNN